MSHVNNNTVRTPLRILNEPAGFMGLTSIDLCALGYILVILHGIFEPFGLGLLAFIFVAIFGYALIAVRLKYRRKIIRDFLISTIGPKVIYDPEA